MMSVIIRYGEYWIRVDNSLEGACDKGYYKTRRRRLERGLRWYWTV